MLKTRSWLATAGVLLLGSLMGASGCGPSELSEQDEAVLEPAASGFLFHSSEEIEGRRILTFEEALQEQGLELSELEREQYEAGQAILGRVQAELPIRHRNGTLEVPAHAREAVQAYVDSRGERGEARQLREFEGKVLHGFYDPLNPSLVEMKHRYLAAQGLPTGDERRVTALVGDGGSAPDAGSDGGSPDAGRDGGSAPDAGSDGGSPDAGSDGGSPDAGTDGGSPDAGSPPDSGVPDAGLTCNVTCNLEMMMVTNSAGSKTASASSSTSCSYGRITQATQGASTAECSSVSYSPAGSASVSWSTCDKQGAGKVGCEFSGNGCAGIKVWATGMDHGTLQTNSSCASSANLLWPTGTGQAEGVGEVKIAEWGTSSSTYSRGSKVACGSTPWTCTVKSPTVSCDVTLKIESSSSNWVPTPGAEAGCEASTGFACTMDSSIISASTSAHASVRSSARAVSISAPAGGAGYGSAEVGSLGVTLHHNAKGTKNSGTAIGQGKGTYSATASKILGSLSKGSVPAGVTVNLSMGQGTSSLSCGATP